MAKRSASDVLLDLEAKFERFDHMLKSLDHNVKLLLNQKHIENLNIKQAENKSQKLAKALGASMPAPKPSVEAADFPQVDPSFEKKRGQRQIEEKLVYKEDGKAIVLGQIEIFDTDNNLIDKKKTNNLGVYSVGVNPGTYLIRVVKQKTAGREKIFSQYQITVDIDQENKPLQLGVRNL